MTPLPSRAAPALFHCSPTPWQLPEPPEIPTRNRHSAPGQAGERGPGEQHSWVSSQEREHHSPEKQGLNEAESAPRQQQGTLQKCCCWARGQQGHITGTAIMNGNITQRTPLLGQSRFIIQVQRQSSWRLTHTHTEQQLEGKAWPWSQSGAENGAGSGTLGVQEHRSSAQVTSQQAGTQSMLQHRNQAHPFLPQPLLPPQFTGLVFSFLGGQHHHKKAGAAGMSPLEGEGAFRRSTAFPDSSCAQRAVIPSAFPAHPACAKPASELHPGNSHGSPCSPHRTSGSTIFQLSAVLKLR